MPNKSDEYWTEIVTAFTTIMGSFFAFRTKKKKSIQDTVEWLVAELRAETERSNTKANEALKLHEVCLTETRLQQATINDLQIKVSRLESYVK